MNCAATLCEEQGAHSLLKQFRGLGDAADGTMLGRLLTLAQVKKTIAFFA